MWKKRMSHEEVADLIDRFLRGQSAYPQEWNDFAETRQSDPEIEEYRKRCDELDPLVNRPGVQDPKAIEELNRIVEKLRSRV